MPRIVKCKNNSNCSGKNTTTETTSTASITEMPQQFSQQQQQQNTSAELTYSTTLSATTGFADKKSITSTNMATVTTAVAPPTINLDPPVINVNAVNSTPADTPSSWASLFAKKSSNIATVAAGVVCQLTATAQHSAPNVPQPQMSPKQKVINNIGRTTHSTPTFATKKLIAKVAPHKEDITLVTPTPEIIPLGCKLYSAASAQDRSPMAPAIAAATATINNKPAKQESAISTAIQRNSDNLVEYTRTLKFADFLTKYKKKTNFPCNSLRPRGLTNRSNYCYINSILQALLGCTPLYNLLRAIPKQEAAPSAVKTPTVNAMTAFMANFSTLPSRRHFRKGVGVLPCEPAFEPTEIYNLWNKNRGRNVEGRQEDAEEFLSYVLNELNDEMLEMICENRNKDSVTDGTDFGRTPLTDIFRGELRSRLEREGEHATDVIQPFFTLQLNVKKAASVKEALEIFVGRNQLEGVTGTKSKQEVVAWQQMTLEKLPLILILHMKWFDYGYHGCRKILKKFQYPLVLDIDTKVLAPATNFSQKHRSYRLFAVVYHDGTEASRGHYITDVYHTGYRSWMRYNDTAVKPVSENDVLLPLSPCVPYLLYYRRCDNMTTHAPTSNADNDNTTLSAREHITG